MHTSTNHVLIVALLAVGCAEEAKPSIGTDAGITPDTALAVDTGTTRADLGDPADIGSPDSAASDDTGSDVGADVREEVDMVPDFGPLDTAPSSTRQTARPLGSVAGAESGYWEYLPPTYGRGPSPLLVFWHGIGENGDGDGDLDKVLSNGPPRYIDRDEWPNERPFVVLSPQHPGGGCPAPAEIEAFLAFATDEYDIDRSRIYLTGLSCGAIGSWNYLGQHIDDTPIAAAVLIAGNGNPAVNSTGCKISQLPLWGFHGDADGTVNVNGTRNAMETLMACPDPKAELKLTIYPGVGHNSWSRTYDLSAGHDIYAWMLTKQR